MAIVSRLLTLALTAFALMGSTTGIASAASSCQYKLGAKIPLRYTGPSLEITLDGEIDGRPARMLVDTGAFASFLTRTGTERLGLSLSSTDVRVDGVGGDTLLYRAHIKDLVVGPIHMNDLDMPVIGTMGSVPSYDAIVGINILNHVDLEISLMDKQIKMFKAFDCGDAYLGYWKTESVAVPLHPDFDNLRSPHFTVKVNGHEMQAIIDSGSGNSSIDLAAARRIGFRVDAPGVKRLGYTSGIGAGSALEWRAGFDSLSIGDETISKPTLNVVDNGDETEDEVILGADFLRAHRVLFAMSQKKLYLSYIGGEVFYSGKLIEPWIEQEADAGNPDAQFVLSGRYLLGEKPDLAKADAWLDKAAANGSPNANQQVGRLLLLRAQFAQAEQHFKAALGKRPSDRGAALMLYLARLPAANVEAARNDLEENFASSAGAWPTPIAEFYLGRIDAAGLLREAASDDRLARERTCEAKYYVVWWYEAHGDKGKAEKLRASRKAQCD